MKSSIAIFASAFLAVASIAFVDSRAAYAQTSETPAHGADHPAPDKSDDKAKEHGGGHEGGCCKMMQDMHGKMHDMKGHESKEGGGDHDCCGMMKGH